MKTEVLCNRNRHAMGRLISIRTAAGLHTVPHDLEGRIPEPGRSSDKTRNAAGNLVGQGNRLRSRRPPAASGTPISSPCHAPFAISA